MHDLGYDIDPFMQDWVSEWADWDVEPEPYSSQTDE